MLSIYAVLQRRARPLIRARVASKRAAPATKARFHGHAPPPLSQGLSTMLTVDQLSTEIDADVSVVRAVMVFVLRLADLRPGG